MHLNLKQISSIALLGLITTQAAFAATYHDPDFVTWIKSNFVSTLSLGQSWEHAGEAQTINLAPDITKIYTANSPTYTLMTGDLFLGVQSSLPHNFQGQLGFDVGATSSADLSGNIWDDANPEFNNYMYQYSIRHQHIAIKGKLLHDCHWPVLPWISATVGVGFNTAYGFTNTPTIFEAVASPNFASHTTHAFTYAIGLGAQYTLNKNWQIGLGYEFADWGKSQLAAPGPSLSHLYTNSLLLNLTYLA